MSDEPTANVTFDELSEEQQQTLNYLAEEYKVKCLESFGKTRNKVIQKIPLPKILASGERGKDTEQDRLMFQDVVHQAVHQAMINQSGVFMNTLRDVIKDAMSGSLMQE